MKKIISIFMVLSLFSIPTYASDKSIYDTNPCFYGDYRYSDTFEEDGYIDTSYGVFSYDEYYSTYERSVPNYADAVLIINGNFIPHQFPKIIDGVSIIPIRTVIENLGGQVKWDSVNKKVEIQKDDLKVEFIINNMKATVNGKTVDLKVPPQIIGGKTYIPLKFVGELLGAEVEFLQGRKGAFPNVIFLTKNEKSQNILISKNQAHDMVSEHFSDFDWGDFVKEFNGDVKDKFEFVVEESPTDRFWIVNIKYDGMLLSPISVWVDIYTGKVYSVTGGYEGVFDVEEGLEHIGGYIRICIFS